MSIKPLSPSPPAAVRALSPRQERDARKITMEKDDLDKLARTLETKRSTGELTRGERTLLDEIDRKRGLAGQNHANKQPPIMAFAHRVYDLSKSQFLENAADPKPVEIPKISAEQAENIISDLNQQFEEKILGQIRTKQAPGPVAPSPASINPGSGTNLTDYIAAVTAPGKVPFMNETSHIDLNKLTKG